MVRIKSALIFGILVFCGGVSFAATDTWKLPELCNNINNLDADMRCLCSDEVGIVEDDADGHFTIDQRVNIDTDEWMSAVPYKHALKMYVRDEKGRFNTHCTANMVRGKIVTAAHCLIKKGSGNEGVYYFQAGDGTELVARVKDRGNWTETAFRSTGDWAILELVNETGRDTVRNNGTNKVLAVESDMYREPIIGAGFGALKVMSDEEIERFKKAFAVFLQVKGASGSLYSGGVATSSEAGRMFLDDLLFNNMCRKWLADPQQRHYYDEECVNANGQYKYTGLNYKACGMGYYNIFLDVEQLKMSKCTLGVYGRGGRDGVEALGCQGWGGNSGGGFYLQRDYSLIGLAHKGSKHNVVGGDRHTIGDSAGLSLAAASNFIDRLPLGNTDDRTGDDDGVDNNGGNSGGGNVDGGADNDVSPDDGVGQRVVGQRCVADDLPEHATAGVYRAKVDGGLNCGDRRCDCTATACETGYRVQLGRCVSSGGGKITLF